MVGTPLNCTMGPTALPHPGCVMKTKAAETMIVVDWAIDLLDRYTGIPFHAEMKAAGKALQKWMNIIRSSPTNLSVEDQQHMRDCMQRHLMQAERAQIHFVPKHHFWAHMTVRATWMGNPKAYNTFLDESLNLLLRTVTAASHRANQYWRILYFINLIGQLGLSEFICATLGD